MIRSASSLFALVAVALLTLWACGDDGSNVSPESPVATVSVTPSTSTLAPGETVQLEAVTQDAAGTVLTDREIAWSSSAEAVATVSETGLVTGVSEGSATIRATSEGKTGSAAITVTMPPLTFASISAGFVHTCALTGAGAAYCWGHNFYGQLGNSTTTDPAVPTSIPTAVSGDLSFSALATSQGDSHTCALTGSGMAYCWGGNELGQLGTGSRTNSSTPLPVSGGLTFTAIAGGGAHTCGLTGSGAAYCWGLDIFGQLGLGTTPAGSCDFVDGPSEPCSTSPVTVSGSLSFIQLAAGDFHSCGLSSSGAAYCWGFNDSGQLGDGSTTTSSTPVAVSGGHSFTALVAGNAHTCGVITSGAAYCWGNGDNNQIGNGSFTTPINPTPVAVSGGQSFTVLSAGTVHTCGLSSSRAAFCWGGGPALGTSTPGSPISAVAGGLSFSSIAAGDVHSCGVAISGVAYCWGENYIGQLGNGTTNDSRTPVRIAGQ
jgi:alpha-tubulin suppressor-like RCC1 family protein